MVGVSVDSKYSHLAWINTPRKQGGLGGALQIPLVADLTKSISRKYNVLMEEAGHTYRGLFIINPKGVLVQATLNDAPVGRSVDETLRLVQAFQYVDEHGEVCPVNWTVPSPALPISAAFFHSPQRGGGGGGGCVRACSLAPPP